LLHSLTNCLASVNYHCVIANFEHFAMQPVLLWFRRDLRLSDNAALIAAAESGRPVVPVYISDEQDQGTASRWWLHHSLASLDKDLRKLGSSLVIRSGSPREVLPEIFRQTGATALFYSRRYEPVSRRQEAEVAAALREADVHAFDDSLLHDPERVMTRSDTPYRVFTPFWKAASDMGDPPAPRPVPASIDFGRHRIGRAEPDRRA
jgi:deoxyribodipyrimidine photo-lyase